MRGGGERRRWGEEEVGRGEGGERGGGGRAREGEGKGERRKWRGWVGCLCHAFDQPAHDVLEATEEFLVQLGPAKGHAGQRYAWGSIMRETTLCGRPLGRPGGGSLTCPAA